MKKNNSLSFLKILILFFNLCVFIAYAKTDAVNTPASSASIKLQKELDAMPREFRIGKASRRDYLEPLGWQYKEAMGLEGHGKNWKFEYTIYKKKNHYAVILSSFDKPRHTIQIENIFLLDNIPLNHVPSLSCYPIPKNKKEAHEQYCGTRASDGYQKIVPHGTGVSCGLSQYGEMLAFVKPPKLCSQTSQQFHAAYYFSKNTGQLEKQPSKGWICNIERSRPASCPELMPH